MGTAISKAAGPDLAIRQNPRTGFPPAGIRARHDDALLGNFIHEGKAPDAAIRILRRNGENGQRRTLKFTVREPFFWDAGLIFQFEEEMAKAAKTNPEIRDEHLPPDMSLIRERLSSRMQYPSEQRDPAFVAMHQCAVIGMVKVDQAFLRSGMLAIAVRPEFWGRGVGTRLMDEAISCSKGRFEEIHLSVYSSNARAKRLYSRFGFVLIGTPTPTCSEKGDDFLERMMLVL